MKKRILITGSTSGIGLETAKMLASRGHHILLHGRSNDKLERAQEDLKSLHPEAVVEPYQAELSDLTEVSHFAKKISVQHTQLDTLINNAGVFKVSEVFTKDGLDVRFVVNAIAPYLLTKLLFPLMNKEARVINLSSAAQASVNIAALQGLQSLTDGEAYAQSKLALTMWSRYLGEKRTGGPAIIAVNPGSFLGSKMVKEAYGQNGKDLAIGAEILTQAATNENFASASGLYFDNDSGGFADPHPDALDDKKVADVLAEIDAILTKR